MAMPVPLDGFDDWYDYLNPFEYLATEAGRVVADGWTAVMLSIWNAGLFFLRYVLNLVDRFTVPDITGDGPAAAVYQTTFWLAGALLLVMVMVQLGVAVFRRDGRSLATVLVGVGQFAIVWAGWIAYGAGVIAACGGLTRALMHALLQVDSWSAYRPWEPFSTEDIVDGTVATVLGFMGGLLWIAALAHFVMMLTRAGALIILVAVTPIAAAGLVADAGRSWFWKSLRWFHAAAFTPVLMVLVLGIGVQLTSGVAMNSGDETQAAIATVIPGVILICIACFSPLALFKLLAFVDPGTSSGAAMRTGMNQAGGLQKLLAAGSSGEQASGAASSTDRHGRSQGESAGEGATSGRFAKTGGGSGGGSAAAGSAGGSSGMAAKAGGALGAAGAGIATGIAAMHTAGTRGASVGADVSNQMGAGHQTYSPDFAAGKPGRPRSNAASQSQVHGYHQEGGDGPDGAHAGPAGPDTGGGNDGPPDGSTGGRQPYPNKNLPPRPALPPAPGAQRPGGGAAGDGTGSGGAAAGAKAVPAASAAAVAASGK